jgi:hypothetical protein
MKKELVMVYNFSLISELKEGVFDSYLRILSYSLLRCFAITLLFGFGKDKCHLMLFCNIAQRNKENELSS